MPTWEDLMRQKGQQMTQAGQNAINQNVDIPAQQKLAALQQMGSGSAPIPGSAGPGGMAPPPAPPQQDLAAPNSASMTQPDAQSRMNAMIQAPLTMQQVQAKLKNQADQDAAAEAHANALQDQDMSGYTDVNPKPNRFSNLKQQVGPAEVDIKNKTNPKEALSADQEEAINKQLSGDDEDEDEKATAGVKQTGTLGGV